MHYKTDANAPVLIKGIIDCHGLGYRIAIH